MNRFGQGSAGPWKRSGVFMEALAPNEAPFRSPRATDSVGLPGLPSAAPRVHIRTSGKGDRARSRPTVESWHAPLWADARADIADDAAAGALLLSRVVSIDRRTI
jgi:hypothetical protein